MILADENIPFEITKSLREQGFEVTSVYETSRGISDEQVIELALKYDFLLLTEDKDFGEWVLSNPRAAVFCNHYGQENTSSAAIDFHRTVCY